MAAVTHDLRVPAIAGAGEELLETMEKPPQAERTGLKVSLDKLGAMQLNQNMRAPADLAGL